MAKSKPNRKRPAPRRVWVVWNETYKAPSQIIPPSKSKWPAVQSARDGNRPGYIQYTVVEFIEVKPKRKARGK